MVALNIKIFKVISLFISIFVSINAFSFISITQETQLQKDYYLGQSFDINYVVYTDNPIDDVIVLSYPKLEGFYKKIYFDLPEDVRVKEKLWKRVKYRVQVTAAEMGSLTLDPLVVSQRGESFEGDSRTIYIKSLPKILETEEKKGFFIGNIGTGHYFEVNLAKRSYRPEELIEIDITLRGPSLMDFIDLPSLFPTDWTLYEKTTSLLLGGKRFHYVFSIPIETQYKGTRHKFFEFSPTHGEYRSFYLEIPSFKVAIKNIKDSQREAFSFRPLLASEYEIYRYSNKKIFRATIVLLLLSFINLLIFGLIKKWGERIKRFFIFYTFEKKIQKNKIVFNDFFSFFNMLSTNPILDKKIEETSLSYESKRYFLNILHHCSKKEFGAYPIMELPFSAEAFEELYCYFVLKKNNNNMPMKNGDKNS